MSHISGKCTKTRELNHHKASRRATRIYDNVVSSYRKKIFELKTPIKLPDSGPKLLGFGRFEILERPSIIGRPLSRRWNGLATTCSAGEMNMN